MAFEKVVVAGGGVLGSQIAFQSAYCGLDTCIWLRSEGSIGRTQPKLDQLVKDYHAQIDAMEAAEEEQEPVEEEKPVKAERHAKPKRKKGKKK